LSTQFDDDEKTLSEIKNRKISWLNEAESFLVSTAFASKKTRIDCSYCYTLLMAALFCSLAIVSAPACLGIAHNAGICARDNGCTAGSLR
jgi:hypothetical protein